MVVTIVLRFTSFTCCDGPQKGRHGNCALFVCVSVSICWNDDWRRMCVSGSVNVIRNVVISSLFFEEVVTVIIIRLRSSKRHKWHYSPTYFCHDQSRSSPSSVLKWVPFSSALAARIRVCFSLSFSFCVVSPRYSVLWGLYVGRVSYIVI